MLGLTIVKLFFIIAVVRAIKLTDTVTDGQRAQVILEKGCTELGVNDKFTSNRFISQIRIRDFASGITLLDGKQRCDTIQFAPSCILWIVHELDRILWNSSLE